MPLISAQTNSGLSPPVRGNPYPIYRSASCAGSIPACAGEPWRPVIPILPSEVYPRLCGGTPTCCCWPNPNAGLSPPVRGNRFDCGGNCIPTGSIPACAGEPSGGSVPYSRHGVYPRLCGGTWIKSDPSQMKAGLSPPVRGNPARLAHHGDVRGAIPACAGEPLVRLCGGYGAAVYPRLCGGTGCGSPALASSRGLSPPVRGNRRMMAQPRRWSRSIPACAGEPANKLIPLAKGAVYPRLCGGTPRTSSPGEIIGGLSPPVRGNPDHSRGGAVNTRSIPACAGEPQRRPRRARRPEVYPRLCGGTGTGEVVGYIIGGLSPPVRGNRLAGDGAGAVSRSIPACAGEPA